MNTLLSKMIAAGVLFLLIFLTGFWLSRSGKPYLLGLFTVHKLLVVASVIFLAVMLSEVRQTIPFDLIQMGAIAISAILLVITMLTGALLSVDKGMPAIVHLFHQITPYLTMISIGATLYIVVIRASLLSPA